MLDEQLTVADNTINQTRRKLDSLKRLIAVDVQQHRETSEALRKSGAVLEKLGHYERLEHDLKAIRRDLARMPADPAGNLAKAREAHEEISALTVAVPLLARLHAQREQLRTARTREEQA